MSGRDDLAAQQGPDPVSVPEQLDVLLGLPSVGMSVRAARIFGQGSRATVELDVSNGETLVWETIRDMTRPANLTAEVVACTGACPILKPPQAFRVVSLVRMLAQHSEAVSDNSVAVDWGMDYLQAADVLDLDMNDRRQRWDAFSRLNDHVSHVSHQAAPWGVLVLRHTSGIKYVRSGWFLTYAKTCDSLSPETLGKRMMRVGWIRTGKEGRVKATHPAFPRHRSFNFWIVPAGWEERGDSQ